MKFSAVVTIDKSDAYAEGMGQIWRLKVTDVNTNFAPIWSFADHNPSLNAQIATEWSTLLSLA